MRDKLVELLEKAESAVYWDSSDQSFVNKIADFLMVNGITFATDNNVGNKPMTNGDIIRSMTDEELAEFLCGVYDEEETDKFICGTIIPNYYEETICDWLKQPCEVGQ